MWAGSKSQASILQSSGNQALQRESARNPRRNTLPSGHTGRRQLERSGLFPASERSVREYEGLGHDGKAGGPETLENHDVGKPFIGSSNGFGDDDPQSKRMGWLTAVDADTEKLRWKYRSALPLAAAVTPTAGGPVGGGIITYSIGGKQYIAVAAGMKNGLMGVGSGPASMVIYALP